MKKFLVLSSWRTALGNLLPSAHGHQGGSRKAAIGSMLIAAFAVVGCDDSSSASAGQNDEPGVESSSSVERGESSSSVIPGSDPESSNSEKAKPSSSDTQSDAKQSSSSEKSGMSSCSTDDASSSSVKSESSSSVETPKSSSSGETSVSSSSSADEQSSSSETAVNSSSSISEMSSRSSEGLDWSLPKEAYLNPDIDYGTMTDERDGKVYRTVKIGDQVWMAENLNYYDSTNLSVKEKSWCYGKNDNGDSSTCDVAGRYYTWAAAIDSVKLVNDVNYPWDCGYLKKCLVLKGSRLRGICPTGWHLPNYYDWQTLLMVAGGTSTASKVLKSRIGWSGNGNGTDAFGFSALPAGFRGNGGIYYLDGNYVYFWTSDGERDDVYDAYVMNMSYDKDKAFLNVDVKYYGQSVRCVKNGADWESNWD